MIKLSETTERKFEESFDVDHWQIETDTGWSDISHIHKTIEYDVYSIKTESNLTLDCADTHILFDENFNEIFAKDCCDQVIQTKEGADKVISVTKTDKKENMFDITVADDNHRFYTNNILS